VQPSVLIVTAVLRMVLRAATGGTASRCLARTYAQGLAALFAAAP